MQMSAQKAVAPVAGPSQTLSTFLSNIRYTDIPLPVVARTEELFLDWFASALAGKYKSDRALLRARVNAGLEQLKKLAVVDAKRTAAMGYCFGGTTVLELARSGAEGSAVVSFHGGLNTPSVAEAKAIKGRVLALHGADDPFVPPAEVATFEEEMRKGGVDWQLVSYGGAVHSFTDWNAGGDHSKGAAYNEKADRRSWEAMKSFFAEVLK